MNINTVISFFPLLFIVIRKEAEIARFSRRSPSPAHRLRPQLIPSPNARQGMINPPEMNRESLLNRYLNKSPMGAMNMSSFDSSGPRYVDPNSQLICASREMYAAVCFHFTLKRAFLILFLLLFYPNLGL